MSEIKFEHFHPNPKQEQFLLSNKRYTAFGGARGGGKSWVVRVKAILICCYYPGIKVLFVRRTYPELYNNHIKELVPMVKGLATYHNLNKELSFKNGSSIKFGYLQNDADLRQYQGLEYDVIFIDEATQLTEDMFKTLVACNRGANSFPKRMYLTCNPGGVGHGWVKRLFVDRTFKKGENPDDYCFIQSLLDDNKVLCAMQPEYREQLEALPHDLREAWLYGSWDVFSGQVFKEFINEPNNLDRKWTHVIKPFEIPPYWTVYRSFDWGFSHPFSVGWTAFSETGCAYRFKEWYGCSHVEDNVGIQLSAEQIAEEIKRIEEEDETLSRYRNRIIGVADPAIFKSDNGMSIANQMAHKGVYFAAGDNHRIAGKMQLHNRLVFDKDGFPMFYVFENCKDFIRTLPLLIYDENKIEDVNTSMEDHCYDECRYCLMENPYVKPVSVIEPKIEYDDPLDLRKEEKEIFYL